MMFYQLFGLSLWRHPFTAEDSLVCKRLNVKSLWIFFDEWTNSSTSWEYIFSKFSFFVWTVPLNLTTLLWWCSDLYFLDLTSVSSVLTRQSRNSQNNTEPDWWPRQQFFKGRMWRENTLQISNELRWILASPYIVLFADTSCLCPSNVMES